MSGMVSLRLIAARACGMMSSPDWMGEKPSPTWYSSGRRNGIPPIPNRVNRLPVTATRKQRMRGAYAVQAIGPEQRAGHGEQSQYLASAQCGFAEHLQHIGQQ